MIEKLPKAVIDETAHMVTPAYKIIDKLNEVIEELNKLKMSQKGQKRKPLPKLNPNKYAT